MCMCLARGGVGGEGGEGIRGLGLGFTILWEQGSVGNVSGWIAVVWMV